MVYVCPIFNFKLSVLCKCIVVYGQNQEKMYFSRDSRMLGIFHHSIKIVVLVMGGNVGNCWIIHAIFF